MAVHHLPENLLDSLEGVAGFDRNTFVNVHESGGQVVSVRLNPSKNKNAIPDILAGSEKIPWADHGYYLPQRPLFVFDPLLHAGAYYVQEASSMFLEQVVKATADLTKPLKVLDLCAAPGGKSTHLQSLISKDSLLISNEVIKPRVTILMENLAKWSALNCIVTNNDPDDFSALHNYFDLIVIDAPCSGSGLFRRDPSAVSEWSETAVGLCQLRQKRILSAALPGLKEDGILVFSTCSYSREEDEEISDWLCDEFPLEPVRISTDNSWNIVETESERHKAPGYRFFPDRLKGEGFYISCFRKSVSENNDPKAGGKKRPLKVSAKQSGKIRDWFREPANIPELYFNRDEIFAFPAALEQDLIFVQSHLYIRHAGIKIGRLMNDDLIPDHEFAVSGMVNAEIPSITLKKEEALQYLRKEEVKTDEGVGWSLVNFEGRSLGWIKRLKNRSNNYYPKDWRILKSAITN